MMSNCKNCGAPIHNGKCEYCGTEYPELVRILTVSDEQEKTLADEQRICVRREGFSPEMINYFSNELLKTVERRGKRIINV